MGLKRGLFRVFQQSVQRPVLLRLEFGDLLIPVKYHAGDHALDPTGRQTPADLFPHHRRDLITHHTIQHAAGLLGVHQILIDSAGSGNALGHHLAGNLVKGNAAGLIIRQLQQVLEMPGNGFSLAVRVGGEIDGVAGSGSLFQLADQFFLAANGFIVRFKIVVDIHAKGTFGQVAQVAHTGRYLIVRPQIFADGLGLGRRLHDHQMFFAHASSSTSYSCSGSATVRTKLRAPFWTAQPLISSSVMAGSTR